jgi:tetratricopeptide (TPR) repeat protein
MQSNFSFWRNIMPIDRKKSIGSSFPISQPSNLRIEPAKIPAEDIDQTLEDALESEDYDGALEALDAAPRWMQKKPEFMLIRATVLMSLGEDQEAFQLLRELERKNPRLTALYLPLSMFYMDREWPAHALQAAKRALSDRDLTEEARASLDELIVEATAMLQFIVKELGLPFETVQRACTFHEQAQIAMDENKFSEVEHFSKEAIKIAPNWNSPHNNRARALYFSGKTADAIAISEAVLARDAVNTYALQSLAIYHFGLNQLEKAREYATRLEELFKKFPKDGLEIEQLITVLALVEDTPALWKIAKRYLDAPSESLFGRSWQCLAVAAVRSGKWKEALSLLEKANEEELLPTGQSLLDELSEIANQRQPRLAWMPPAYPGADILFHPKVLAEWESLLRNVKEDTLSPSQKRKFDALFQKYPFMVAAMKCLLWDEKSCEMAAEVLGMMESPDADAEILRFALSDTGDREARLNAIMTLIQSGRYTGPKIVNIWFEDLEEWREIELNTQRIGDIEANVQPKTLALIEKARKTKNPQEEIALLRKAVEMEPTSPIAVFNLGVRLTQSGKVDEGRTLIQRSVEVDPNYTYGHASIALTLTNEGREREALDHLDVVTHAEIITPETAVVANLAWANLFIQKHELESARQRFDMATQIDPEHHLLERYEKMLTEAEELDDKFGFLFEYQRKSAQRAHQKLLKNPLAAEMGLRACLGTYTKDMLVGAAHFLRTTSSGKKGELADWLAESLLDEEFLQETLDEDLEEKEREALRWLLETDGVRLWKEFVHKYGDDMDESTYWNYNEPESIPGRLKISGLLYTGMLDGQQVAFLPADVRPLLRTILK